MSDPKSRVDLPGIFLIVTGALGIAMQLLSMLSTLSGIGGMGRIDPEMLEGMSAEQAEMLMKLQEFGQDGGVVLGLVTIAVGAFIVFGGMKMRSLEGYGIAIGASVLAMIPCLSPCCCLGLPIGIWALVVLSDAEVKAAFR